MSSNENETYAKQSSVAPHNFSWIVLEPTGLLQQLVWAKHIQEWKVLWVHPTTKCEIYPSCDAPTAIREMHRFVIALSDTWMIRSWKIVRANAKGDLRRNIWTAEKFLVQLLADDVLLRDFYGRIAQSDLKEERNKKEETHFEFLNSSCVLKKATTNFSEKIGEGGFSSVHQGVLPDSTPIAVKKLLNQNHSNKQYVAEVRSIGTIQQCNVVRLRGFCAEQSKRFLVYGYLANELEYLHERCRDCIIHCDIKPENILLDAELAPQIVDFGLAKLLGWDVSRVTTTMRGIRGYLPPEWISGGAITSKVDVFSCGKLLFEIISGKRDIEELNSNMRNYLPLQVANC
ncbi:G-type lectin S-receptor-like serine/threonine-protein kinase At2g19130 [Rutidosis leptorrhynchoides]|uniref:G-type lectin S-receptor-like serine/threonine-protein kinase At2g19130 n=1 Tax=Rutidosis leptorrhynchoides TaxID=125765 RepID=UPI003A99B821